MLLIICLGTSARAAIISGFDPVRHERFLMDGSPNPGFLVDESQISGVALQRGILITPRHYITATHVDSTEATFRGSDGVLRTYQSSSSQILQTNVPGEGPVSSDLRLHTLTMEVDPSIEPVPVVVGNFDPLIGRTIFAFDQQMRGGRNTIDEITRAEFPSGSGDSLTIRFSYDTDSNGGTGGLGIDEIGLLGGDSGNAALIEIDGRIGVIGAHMGIDVPTGSSAGAGDRYDSFTTLAAAYEDQLRDFLAADGYSLQTLTAVPEPANVFCCVLVLSALGLRRGRRRAHVKSIADAFSLER